MRNDLWLDEALSLAATRRLGETLSETGGTMALYYLFLYPIGRVTTEPMLLRLPSLVAMALALVILCLYVNRVLGRRAAFATGLVAAALPLTPVFAAEARSYAFVAAATTLAWYAVDRDIESPGRWRWVAVASIVSLPLLHGLAPIQSILLCTVTAYTVRRGTLRIAIAIATVASLLIVGILWSIGASGVGAWVPPMSWGAPWRYLRALTWPDPAIAILILAAVAVGAVRLMRTGSGNALARHRRLALIAWGPGAIASLLMVSLIRPSQLERYNIAAVLALAALIAAALDGLQKRHLAVASTCLIVPLVLAAPVPSRPGQWTRATDLVSERAEPNEQILFSQSDARMPFEAAWVGDSGKPELDIVGPGDPLGTFDRFAAYIAHGETPIADPLLDDIDPAEPVWLIDAEFRHQPNLADKLDDGLRDLGLEVELETEIGSITIRRYRAGSDK